MLTQFYSHLRENFQLTCISELLGWDQQVNLPAEAGPDRAKQLEIVAGLIHARLVDEKFIQLVRELHDKNASFGSEDALNIREIFRMQQREKKLPSEFVALQARTHAEGYQTWADAKPKNDFAAVQGKLEEIVRLARQEAEYVGYEGSPYNALFDKYEPYGKIEIVRPLLLKLAAGLRDLLPSIIKKCEGARPLKVLIDPAIQKRINERVARDIGYSFRQGRLDAAPHPFMTTLGSKDFRITTRYYEDDFFSSLFSTLHEAGHALYESGCREEWIGTPAGRFASLGVHESQSRLWENLIGRSRSFSIYLQRVLTEEAPALGKVLTPESIWQHTNLVTPSFIRVEADEVTYSLHVVIRMLLEERLINGTLEVKELPAAWNELYKEYLGITPPTDKLGVLQDVHWYSGSLGYFPTYALGNLYGASFLAAAREALPNLEDLVAAGDFSKLLGWLRSAIHTHGMLYQGPELVEQLTGAPVSEAPFLNYLSSKFDLIH